MNKPTLYGTSSSRAIRAVWGIEETGIDYNHVPTHFIDDSKTPDYLAINPNGRIPALQDGDVTLFESMAINLYLAKKYGGDLYPNTLAGEGNAWQWSVWGISEIEPLQMQIVVQKFFTPDDRKDPKVVERANKGLQRPLAVLDTRLAQQEFLAGDKFGLADLQVASVMLLFQMAEIPTDPHANVTRWAQACYSREALTRAQAKG